MSIDKSLPIRVIAAIAMGGKITSIDDVQEIPTPVACCEEMELLLLWSNNTVENAEILDDIDDLDDMLLHPDHVKLRKEILNHQCKVKGT